MSTLLPLLYAALQLAACMVIALRYGRASRVLSIVAGSLWLFTGGVHAFGMRYIMQTGGREHTAEYLAAVSFVGLAAWACFLIALIAIPEGKAGAAVTGYGPAPDTSGGRPPVISKNFYLGSVITAFLLTSMLGVAWLASMTEFSRESLAAAMSIAIMMMVPVVYLAVVMAVFLYKIWRPIQDGRPRATPGQAVGYLFIPLFNFYWIFQAYWGWTKDFNAYAREKASGLPRMPEGLALAICIMTVLGVIPYTGMVFSFVNAVLVSVFVSKACDGVNALSWAKSAATSAQA